MDNMQSEKCCICNEITGRKGTDIDSLYCYYDGCEQGPFCEKCFDKHIEKEENFLKELIFAENEKSLSLIRFL